MTPIAGWLPDADPTTPGMFSDCQHVISTVTGYRGAPASVKAKCDPLAGAATGAALVRDLTGNRTIYAGTPTALFQLTGSAWRNVSKSGGYSGSLDTRWSFAQFGNTTMAANLSDPMQQKLESANAFADVPSAPKARIIVNTANNFVLAFYTVDGTYGNSPDRWWCSAQNNQADWTPNVSTGANTGRLIAAEGEIIAAGSLGDLVVAYKEEAIFIGSFVGAPIGFQWNKVPGGTAGCVGQEAWCDIGGAHFVVGPDTIWIFDGTRPLPIGRGEVRDWFYQNSNPIWRYRTQCVYDRQFKLVRVAYPSTASNGELDASITYNVATKKWSRDDMPVSSFLNFVQPGVTIDGMDAYASTINALPAVPVDSPFWSTGGESGSYFDPQGQLWNLNGDTLDSYFVTGDVGNDDAVSMIERVRVRYSQAPLEATCSGQYRMNEGTTLQPGPVNELWDGKFDIRQTARWHRFRVDMNGPHMETAYDAKPIAAGMR